MANNRPAKRYPRAQVAYQRRRHIANRLALIRRVYPPGRWPGLPAGRAGLTSGTLGPPGGTVQPGQGEEQSKGDDDVMTDADIKAKALALLAPNVQAGFRVDPVLVARGLVLEVHLADFYDPALMGLLVRRARGKWIVVKAGADPVMQRFVIAHQVGHVVLHSDLDQEGDIMDCNLEQFFYGAGAPIQEIQANEFAVALLMPPYNLYKVMKANTSPALLARIFGVPPMALAYRMGLLGLTNVVPDVQEGVG